MSGGILFAPACTARIVAISSVAQAVLQQVAARSGLERPRRLNVPGVGRQHDDARVRKLRANGAVASTPFISGIFRSISVTSGR